MKLLQTKHTEVLYTIDDEFSYWIVCEKFKDVDEIVEFSKSLLKTLDIKPEDVENLKIVYEDAFELRLMLSMICSDCINSDKFLSKVPKGRIKGARFLRGVKRGTMKFESRYWNSTWCEDDGVMDDKLNDCIKYLEDLVEKQ